MKIKILFKVKNNKIKKLKKKKKISQKLLIIQI